MQQLKKAAIRGGIANLCAQVISAALRIGTLIVLARLLSPNDFGIVAMVTSIMGVLNLFKDFGLSTATIQRTSVTHDQLSALFWINMLVGAALAGVALAGASSIANFYREPRLFWIAVALASSFLINATAIQHSALLQRQMRFALLAFIETCSLLASVIIGIALAVLGFGYWALVGMTLSNLMIYGIFVWVVSGWRPAALGRAVDIIPMVKVGGIVTANGIIMYFAYNLDKVLLGRFWGAEALGLYGRAHQLISFPTDSLNSAVGGVLLSALSRVKDQRERWKSYFLKGYSLLIAVTFPITAVCALFADDIIYVVLGPKWVESGPIFRYLTPTILIFGMINPMWSLLVSLGLLVRSLRMALVLAPIVVAGYVIGLHWGPTGVAIGISTSMTLWVVPHIAWTIHGTPILMRDIIKAVGRPFVASIIAGLPAAGIGFIHFNSSIAIVRLALGVSIFIVVYGGVLLFVMRQWSLFGDVLTTLRKRSVSVEGSD